MRAAASFIAENAEDIALALGLVLLSAGLGSLIAWQWSLIASGALLIAYGVWITERRP